MGNSAKGPQLGSRLEELYIGGRCIGSQCMDDDLAMGPRSGDEVRPCETNCIIQTQSCLEPRSGQNEADSAASGRIPVPDEVLISNFQGAVPRDGGSQQHKDVHHVVTFMQTIHPSSSEAERLKVTVAKEEEMNTDEHCDSTDTELQRTQTSDSRASSWSLASEKSMVHVSQEQMVVTNMSYMRTSPSAERAPDSHKSSSAERSPARPNQSVVKAPGKSLSANMAALKFESDFAGFQEAGTLGDGNCSARFVPSGVDYIPDAETAARIVAAAMVSAHNAQIDTFKRSQL